MSDASAHTVRLAAAEWHDRRERDDWSKDDQSALDAWLAQSPAHKIAFLRVDAAWKRADRLTALKPSGGPVTKKPEPKLSITWKVDNPDKDDMRYRLKYRLVGTNVWYDLSRSHEVVTKETYDWDTSNLPEGRYRVRVTATDELANPPDRVTRQYATTATCAAVPIPARGVEPG